ncbi:MAG: phosphate ABC transporter ATP-binding protein [Chloroflexota bacterium]
MAETVYLLEGVVKAYNGREICHIEHLEVRSGEIFGLMGPSGAGKTTLLRLLNFLEPPTSGTIHFLNFSSNGHAAPPLELRRRVTMVFQEPMLFSATVEANVAYGLRLRQRSIKPGQLREALERVGLTSLAKAQAATLSGGEKQRVALARALLIQPSVLLLDEPTANLDPYNVALIEESIATINREMGATIVLVTHNVFQAQRLSQRVGLLLDGRVVEVGDVQQVFTQPKDPRTAAFIRGDMIY